MNKRKTLHVQKEKEMKKKKHSCTPWPETEMNKRAHPLVASLPIARELKKIKKNNKKKQK